MRSFLSLSLFLALATTSARAQDASVDPATYFPDDSTAVTGIRNLTKLYELEDDHPIKEFAAHPAVKHVFGELVEGFASDFDEEFYTDIGMSKEDLARAFPGRFAVGGRIDLSAKGKIAAAEEGIEHGGSFNFGLNTVNPDIAAIADCTLTDDELAELLEGVIVHENRSKEEAEAEDEELPKVRYSLVRERSDGLTLFRIEAKWDDKPNPRSVVIANVEGVLVAGTLLDIDKGMGDGYFADVVLRVESGGREKGSMGSTDRYLDAMEKIEDTDFFFYAPLEKLAMAVEATITESYDQAEQDGNPVGLFATKDAILKTIGLGDFKAFTLAGTIVPEGFVLFNELGFNERRGIISKILRYDDRGIELPDFAPEGLTGVGVSSLDFGGMLTELLAAMKAMSPMVAGMLDMQIAQLEKEGLSVKDGIMGSLGIGVSSFAGYSSDDVPDDRLPSHLFVLDLSDPAGMDRALAGFRAYLEKMGGGKSEKREFMGETIYRMDEMAEFLGSMVDLDADATASYAIIGNRLLVAGGELDFMEHCITSMKKKGAALDEDPAIEEAWRRWGDKDLVEFAYEDAATFLKSLVLGTSEGVEFSVEDEEIKEAVKEAADEFPSVEDLHFYIASKTYNTPDALSGWMILAKKPKP